MRSPAHALTAHDATSSGVRWPSLDTMRASGKDLLTMWIPGICGSHATTISKAGASCWARSASRQRVKCFAPQMQTTATVTVEKVSADRSDVVMAYLVRTYFRL